MVAVAGGFLAWGAVFPTAAFFGRLPSECLGVTPELWNVPKFFVAMGMMLKLLEDKSQLVEEAHAREHAENLLLQKMSQISSRLLSSRDPFALCGDITRCDHQRQQLQARGAVYPRRRRTTLAGERQRRLAGGDQPPGRVARKGDLGQLPGAARSGMRVGNSSVIWIPGNWRGGAACARKRLPIVLCAHPADVAARRSGGRTVARERSRSVTELDRGRNCQAGNDGGRSCRDDGKHAAAQTVGAHGETWRRWGSWWRAWLTN